MRRLSRAWWTGLAVIGGLIWGWGLARWLAEGGLLSLLYRSPWMLAGLVLACGVIAGLGWCVGYRRTQPGREEDDFSQGECLFPLLLPLLYVLGLFPHPLAGGVLLVGGLLLTVLLLLAGKVPWLPPLVLVVIVFVLYLNTLLPGLGEADAFEFQVIAPRMGVAHPTGYPLFVLLGKMFTWLPVGNMAWRVNLSAAVYATAAVGMLYGLVVRLLGGFPALSARLGRVCGLLAAFTFAFSPVFWSQAVIAEVYTLHNLLLAVILFLLLPDTAPHLAPFIKWALIFFLSGLSLTNHLTTALLLPAIGVGLLWAHPRLRVRQWLSLAALFALGLSVYVFIPLRWPALNDGVWMTRSEFFTYITGGQFHGALQISGVWDPTRWQIVWRLLYQPFGWAGLLLAGIGLVGLGWRHRRALVLTLLTFMAFVGYGLAYYVPDVSVFFIPAQLFVALWLGMGLGTLVVGLHRLKGSHAQTRLRAVVCGVLVMCALLPMSQVWRHMHTVDQSGQVGRLEWGRYVLALPLDEGAALLVEMEKFAPLYYLQQVEGLRPDLDIVVLGNEDLYLADMHARLEAGQTVYLGRYLPHLEGLHLSAEGPLVQVAAPRVAPQTDSRLARFGAAIELSDADLTPWGEVQRSYHVALTWQATAPMTEDLLVQLRLVDERQGVAWNSVAARPVHDLYPTNAWPVDVAVCDHHQVALPDWLPPGQYELQVGLFPPFSDRGVTMDGGGSWQPVGTLTATLPVEPLLPLAGVERVAFADGAWLVGSDLPVEVPAGAAVTVDLAWQDVPADGHVQLAWQPIGDGAVVPVEAQMLSAGMPRSQHVITAPQAVGDYALLVGREGVAAFCDWLVPAAERCRLGRVTVLPVQEGLANFEGLVILLNGTLGDERMQPGETLPIDLRWRALRAMDADYTVFVQLIGPDGRLYGQIDAWPVQGTRPTSRWGVGEEIDDPYQVMLAADAPAGVYHVHVGWYLLETMRRLNVVDTSSRPVGDTIVLGEVYVD